MSRSRVVQFAAVSGVAALCWAGVPASAVVAVDDQQIQVIGGGTVDEQWQNPGAVLTTADGKQHCTGIRIGPRWVVTARHCYHHPFEDHTFNIDAVYTDSVKALQGPKAVVKKVHVAPTADTVLLELAEVTAGPVTGWSDQRITSGTVAEFYGWGYTSPFGRTLSKDLKRGEASANGYTGGSYYGGQNVTMRGKNSCTAGGDSGGPFFADGLAIGNLSWGMAGATAQFCVTGIVPFAQNADWIKDTTGIAPNGGGYYLAG